MGAWLKSHHCYDLAAERWHRCSIRMDQVERSRRDLPHGRAHHVASGWARIWVRETLVPVLVVLCVAAGLRLYRISDWPVFMDEDDYTQ